MPILWRYLLKNYLKIFSLCVFGFLAIILVIRFQSIARFAATGATKIYVFKFVFLQLPYILPFAIPISCLIASLLLFRSMSHSHELTALRTAGIGFLPMTFPLIVMGVLIGLFNFTIVSEIAPKCRRLSKSLVYEMTSMNPLCLLQKDTLIKFKDTFIDLKMLKSGKYATDVCFIIPNYSHERLGLILAKKLCLKEQAILGKDVSFISSIPTKDFLSFDHLVIENQGGLQTNSTQLSQYLRGNDTSVGYDALDIRMIRAKQREEKSKFGLSPRAALELARRFSLGVSAFIFTLVGIFYGIEISRSKKTAPILWASSLFLFYLTCFLMAKSIKHDPFMGIILYLLPLVLIAFVSFYHAKTILGGKGS